jgi:hypothetical protein
MSRQSRNVLFPVRQDSYGSLFQLFGQLPVLSSSVQLMDDRQASLSLSLRKPPHLLFVTPISSAPDRQVIGLLSRVQGIQPISFGLLDE